MEYRAYRRSFDRAREAILTGFPSQRDRLTVTSLAGGFYGLLWPLADDSGHVILARDMDGDGQWVAWCEEPDGERVTDDGYLIGHVRPRDYAVELAAGAARCLSAQRPDLYSTAH